MIWALQQEIGLSKTLLQEQIKTIYFGGGTPSILTQKELILLLKSISCHFTISDNCEITLEANPDDVSKSKLLEWKTAGVNRLSIGVQSFQEDDLKLMNRAHSVQEALGAISNAKAIGFDNINVDLMYGLPSLSDKQWERNLQQFITLKIPHLSAYNLTLEEQSALPKMIALGKSAPLDEEKNVRQFELLIKTLKAAGYQQYEISNFSLPGWRSKHNSAYWSGEDYLGIGPSAHSYLNGQREHNVSHNMKYIATIEKGDFSRSIEQLSNTERFNEFVMVQLRLAEGISLVELEKKFPNLYPRFRRKMKKEISDNHLHLKKGCVSLLPKGKLLADQIAMHLFAD